MAIKTISQFDAATPTSNDKILFEQNGEGKSATIGDAVNTCSLTYEEIMASTDPADLSRKVASASAIKKTNSIISYHNTGESLSFTIFNSCLVIINGASNSYYYMGIVLAYNALDMIISDGTYDSHISYNENTGLLTLPTSGYYRYAIIF